MKRGIIGAVLALAIVGCSEETEERFERAGEHTGAALESAAEDIEVGVEHVAREADEEISEAGEAIERERREELAEEAEETRVDARFVRPAQGTDEPTAREVREARREAREQSEARILEQRQAQAAPAERGR